MTLPLWRDSSIVPVAAPDGSAVRPLAAAPGGSMATFRLAPGQVAAAVEHRTVTELWFVVSGQGELWRRWGDEEQFDPLEPGLSLALPVGCAFQFRCSANTELVVLGVTMPPWPGEGEAIDADGPWTATAQRPELP